LLRFAALVHDAGRAYGPKGHEKVGARMLAENTSLPLFETERRRLRFLTRHHRGRLPNPGDECYLERTLDNVRTMRVLLGLLRAADGLDSRAGRGAQLVMTARDRRVTVHGYLFDDADLHSRLLTKQKKLGLFESVLSCEVHVKWFSIDRLALLS
jgi:exopolyphosphatase/pppGpp-phosphohydrolase